MPTIDSDAHVIESERTWSYLAESERRFAPLVLLQQQGQFAQTNRGNVAKEFFMFDVQVQPKDRNVDVEGASAESREMADVAARVRHMDELAIDVQILYPTIFLSPCSRDAEAEMALVRAYNRWLADIWKLSDNRLRWAAMVPLAIERLKIAIKQAKEYGLLGEDILGSGFSFDVEIRLGAGAFVCGEETALLQSLEGKRGMPVPKPPFPAVQGLWKKPTVINNVETFANVAFIMAKGAEWFSKIGTEKSRGTKTFALTGKINNSGLVEVPMGTTLREIIYDIGGGIRGGKALKGVQTGGPSGGIITAESLDQPITYESLSALGSMMGSGGMIIMDEDDCVVDIAKFYMAFCVDESCGKCAPCRIGTSQMHAILDKISKGTGSEDDLAKLEKIGKAMTKASLCLLGGSAANPTLSTLRHFREEYLEHIRDHKCRAGKCKDLVVYEIDAAKCIGCGLCARKCPVPCIAGEKKQAHVIDKTRCIKCGECFKACKFGAVNKK